MTTAVQDLGTPTTFLCTAKQEESRRFFNETLGFELLEDSPFVMVFLTGATTLRVNVIESFTPQPFTVLGWGVESIRNEIAALTAKGVTPNFYEGMGQAEDGVWTAPGGALIWWFTDPDGNVLSLAQM